MGCAYDVEVVGLGIGLRGKKRLGGGNDVSMIEGGNGAVRMGEWWQICELGCIDYAFTLKSPSNWEEYATNTTLYEYHKKINMG